MRQYLNSLDRPFLTAIAYVSVAAVCFLLSAAAIGLVLSAGPAQVLALSFTGVLFIAVTGGALLLVLRSEARRQGRLADRLGDVMIMTRDGLWSWDLDRDSIVVTPASDIDHGWQAARAISDLASWRAAVHPDDWDLVGATIDRLAGGERRFAIDQRVAGRDGEWVWHRIKCDVVDRHPNGAPLLIKGAYFNIDEFKTAELAAQRYRRALGILVAVNRVLDIGADREKVARDVCDAIAGSADVSVVRLSEVRESIDTGYATLAESGAAAAAVPDLSALWRGRPFAETPAGLCLKSGSPYVVNDLRAAPDRVESPSEARRHGVQSLIAIPIAADLDQRHVLEVGCGEIDAFKTDVDNTYSTLAQDFGLTLRSIELGSRFAKAEAELALSGEKLERALRGTISSLETIVETRDPYTAGHQNGVALLAAAIASEMGLSPDHAEGIYIGASMHDIGKIGVPTEILSKPGKLDSREVALIQRHAEIGHQVVKDIDFGWPVVDIVHQHHERFDGSGYPMGLVGDAICLEARIVAVADVIESMATDRPYRKSHSEDDVLAEIKDGNGCRYDPRVIDAALTLIDRHGGIMSLLDTDISPFNVDKSPI